MKFGYVVVLDSILDKFDDGHGPMNSKVTPWPWTFQIAISQEYIEDKDTKLTYVTDNEAILKVLDDGQGSVNIKVTAWPWKFEIAISKEQLKLGTWKICCR
jgi:hypothetical protein